VRTTSTNANSNFWKMEFEEEIFLRNMAFIFDALCR
jgi:hypothetical protein